jgi:hypothetical protein
MRLNLTIAALVLAVCPGLARPEVLDSAAHGFTLKMTLEIAATPDTVYRRLIHVGDWWDSSHTFSGDSHNLSIEEKPSGCFCEKLPNQGFVRHMQVVFLIPGKTLVLNGGLGPLMMLGTTGAMTIQLSGTAGGTKLDVGYAVAGYAKDGMNNWAAKVDAVLAQQFTRLKSYTERGPEGLKPSKQP